MRKIKKIKYDIMKRRFKLVKDFLKEVDISFKQGLHKYEQRHCKK